MEDDREQGAINHSEGTRLNPEEHFPRRILGKNLLGDRNGGRGRRAKSEGGLQKSREGVSLLPEMLPSIMLFWNAIYKIIPLYNTIGIMVLAYVVLYLTYTMQYAASAFTQINENLIEDGHTFAGWIMIFIIAFRDLVTESLIAPPDTLVVSTYINREFEQGSVSPKPATAHEKLFNCNFFSFWKPPT